MLILFLFFNELRCASKLNKLELRLNATLKQATKAKLATLRLKIRSLLVRERVNVAKVSREKGYAN